MSFDRLDSIFQTDIFEVNNQAGFSKISVIGVPMPVDDFSRLVYVYELTNTDYGYSNTNDSEFYFYKKLSSLIIAEIINHSSRQLGTDIIEISTPRFGHMFDPVTFISTIHVTVHVRPNLKLLSKYM